MAKHGFWSTKRRVPGEKQVEGAHETWQLLDFIHPPTASAFALGAAGGAYLGWKLFQDKGLIAVVLGIIGGAVLGVVVGVAGYWLLRLFTALGN